MAEKARLSDPLIAEAILEVHLLAARTAKAANVALDLADKLARAASALHDLQLEDERRHLRSVS
jgi:hypothetical protein